MPAWITHLVIANRLKQEIGRNEFIFANVMPDILQGYHIKKVSNIVGNYQTHYPYEKDINGITIPLPNLNQFEKKYKNKMQNPIIKGYYCHLLADYFWNTYTYGKYFENFDVEKELVKIELKEGTNKIMKWDEAVKIKQKDFKNLTNYLKKNEKINIPVYHEDIKKYSEDLQEFQFTQEDIENTILCIQEMINSEEEKEEYSMFSEEELVTILENSIQFIKEKIKE